ncbi:MAG: hypothetical protein SNH13_01205 [Rikenellaceae bacterium]
MKKISLLLAALTALLQLEAAPTNVTVDINLSTTKSYGETTTLERDRYFNYHGMPNHDFTNDEWSYLKGLGIGVGRSFMGGNPGSSVSKSVTYAQMQKNSANWHKFLKQKFEDTTYGPEMFRGTIITNHPTPGKGNGNSGFVWRGVGADYTREADMVVKYLKAQFLDNDLELPSYYEPLNEPFVHANDFKKAGDKTASEDLVRVEMSRFHKAIADAVHKAYGGKIKVGGYASAWPYMEGFNSDFKHWESRMKTFIDTAGDNIDFYSIHIYDGRNVEGEATLRSGSNMEALMDLIEGYTFIKHGKIKPLVISEHGMTAKGMVGEPYSPQRNWEILRSMNHQTMQFMMRADNVEKCIPFITGKAAWFKNANPYPWVISRKSDKGGWEWTHLVKYYELWSGVQGNYADAASSEVDVLALATTSGKDAFIMLNNLEEDAVVSLNIAEIAGNKVKKATIRRLSSKNDIPSLTEEKFSPSTDKLSISNGETIVITLRYTKDIKPTSHLSSKRFYASSYLKPIVPAKELPFEVKIDKGEIARATLKVAIACPIAQAINPKLMVNGKEYAFPRDWKGYDQTSRTKEGFFGTIDIKLNPADLKTENTVSLTFAEGRGTVSTAAIEVEYKR